MSEAKKISACPSWLGLSEDRRSFVFRPERAEIVRKIYELAIGGLGSYAIANLLDRQKVPAFGPSETWDHTTIDNMLRNRATLGEYQPRSYAGGSKKGVPTGPPVANYYPAVIDETTFQAAQVARRQNLISGRGRKGNNLANLFGGLATCAYCRSEVKFHSHGQAKSLICSTVLANEGCTRTAWSYRDFEVSVLHFLAHPALLKSLSGAQQEILTHLVDDIKRLSGDQVYDARYSIALSLKKVVSELSILSAGPNPTPRLSGALVRRDVPSRCFDIRVFDGQLYRIFGIY